MDDPLDTVVYDTNDADTPDEQDKWTGPNLTASLAYPSTSTSDTITKGQDVLQASLSDIVFSHSLTPTENGDTGDVVLDEKEMFEMEFDNIIMTEDDLADDNGADRGQDPQLEISVSESSGAGNVGPSQEEQVSINTISPARTRGSPISKPEFVETGKHSDAANTLMNADDFDDAVDPALLVSCLKTAQDSDDEFEFDLPAGNAKSSLKPASDKLVRFSGMGMSDNGDGHNLGKPGGCINGEKNASPSVVAAKTVVDKSVQNAAAATKPVVGISAASTVQSGGPNIVQHTRSSSGMEADVKPTPMNLKHNQENEAEEDRSREHIITSSAADWDNVETVEAGFSDLQPGEGGETMILAPALLSFSEIWQHFRGVDHSLVKDKIQTSVQRSGFSAFVHLLFGPPKLHHDLQAERDLVFCVAATALDNQVTCHVQSLQTVYRTLTGSRFNCQRFGSHWEEIGFQGRDPATDLRGTGMLALTQLLYFLQDPSTTQLARDLYKLSLHPTQNFPFCVMCINISRICLQSLREDILNKECNKQRAVMMVVNQFYVGALLHLYRLWKQGKTISDSGFVIKEVETRSKKSAKDVFKDLQTYIASQKPTTDATGDEEVNFFSVVKSDKSKTAAELY